MSEETIYDQNQSYQNPHENGQNEETVMENDATQVSSSKGEKKKGLGAAGAAGIAAGVGATVGAAAALGASMFFPNEEDLESLKTDNPEDLETENQEEAEAEQVEAPAPPEHLTGHMMDVATGVNDSMSFSEAFAAARQEVGPGGIFQWHGHSYGTYYANEWNAMSADDQEQYWANVFHTTPHIHDNPVEPNPSEPHVPNDPIASGIHVGDNHGDISNITINGDVTINVDDGSVQVEPTPEDPIAGTPQPGGAGEELPIVEPEVPTPEPPAAEPLELSESDVIMEFDVDDNGMNDVAFVNANDNDSADIIFDTSGNGQYDTLVVDPTFDEAGNLVVDEGGIQDIGGITLVADDQGIIDDTVEPQVGDGMFDNDVLTDNLDVDPLASLTPDPDITIDNDMDMSDFA